jgi:hypothetical protein
VAYDTTLADRIRAALRRASARAAPPREIRMFGGLCFTVGGHMCCGIIGRDLVVRVGPEGLRDALAEPHARPMDFTGRPLKGFVYVGPAGCRRPADLSRWLGRALSFVGSLPPKESARRGGNRAATRTGA